MLIVVRSKQTNFCIGQQCRAISRCCSRRQHHTRNSAITEGDGFYASLVRNADYRKEGRPYLDAIEFSVAASRSTALLSFVAGRYDNDLPQ